MDIHIDKERIIYDDEYIKETIYKLMNKMNLYDVVTYLLDYVDENTLSDVIKKDSMLKQILKKILESKKIIWEFKDGKLKPKQTIMSF